MEGVLFAVVGALSATSGVGVVVNRRPLYSALSLVVNMISLAALFLMLSAQFLAAAQVIVYAGAVMVLFVFVITLLNPGRQAPLNLRGAQAVGALGFGVVAVGLSGYLFLTARTYATLPPESTTLGSIQAVGAALYNAFAFPFEATGLLLVVAAVGAVYLSRGR